MGKYKCPCCGYITLTEPSGSYDICPVCFWEDDPYQSENPDYEGGANRVSLNQCKVNFRRLGACEEEMMPYVRKPLDSELESRADK